MIPRSAQIERETIYRARFVGIYVVLVAVAVAAIAVGSLKLVRNVSVVTHTRTLPATVGSTASLEAALGAGAQAVDGSAINPNLAGAKCDVWQRKSDLVIVCHA